MHCSDLNCKKQLHTVILQVTNKCNLNCIHCHRGAKGTAEMDVQLFKEIIDELSDMGTKNINISGGEPFLHSKIMKMITYAKKKKINVSVSTNGTLLSEKLIQKISKIGIKIIKISLDSSNPVKHDFIRGIKGSFETVKTKIYLLRKHKIPFVLVTTLMDQKLSDYKKIFELAYEWGAIAHKTNSIVPFFFQGKKWLLSYKKRLREYIRIWKEARVKYESKLIITAETMFAIQIGVDYFMKKYKKNKVFSDICLCPAGREILAINEKGDVLLCPFFPDIKLGNLYTQKIKEIYFENPILLKLRQIKSMKFCKECKYKNFCIGCRARAYKINKNLYAPDPLCFANIKK